MGDRAVKVIPSTTTTSLADLSPREARTLTDEVKRDAETHAALCQSSKTILDVFDEDGIQVAAAVSSYDELAGMVEIAKENARVYRELGRRIELVIQARRDAGIDDPPTSPSIGDERS